MSVVEIAAFQDVDRFHGRIMISENKPLNSRIQSSWTNCELKAIQKFNYMIFFLYKYIVESGTLSCPGNQNSVLNSLVQDPCSSQLFPVQTPP